MHLARQQIGVETSEVAQPQVLTGAVAGQHWARHPGLFSGTAMARPSQWRLRA
jgi:hypothetical protein